MKVLHVITDLKDGGAEAVLFRLISNDVKNEHSVICLGDGGKYVQLLKASNINVDVTDLKSGFKGIWLFLCLINKVKAFNPNVIQGWMYHGSLAASILSLLTGCKNVVWGIHHTNLVPGADRLLTRIISATLSLISRYLPRLVTKIVCCGEEAKNVHREYGYDSSKLEVIYNGYDLNEFRPIPELRSSYREQIGVPDQYFVIGSIGRYVTQKDHPNLIKALALFKKRHKEFHLLLVGKGCDKENIKLRSLINQSGLTEHVSLMGTRTDIVGIMNAMDLHVTSSAFGEAFPNVICEAMACKSVCVSTDVGDVKEIIGVTGLVVPPSNCVQLCDAIEKFFHCFKLNQEHWNSLSQAAREKVKSDFNIDIMVSKYNQAWL